MGRGNCGAPKPPHEGAGTEAKLGQIVIVRCGTGLGLALKNELPTLPAWRQLGKRIPRHADLPAGRLSRTSAVAAGHLQTAPRGQVSHRLLDSNNKRTTWQARRSLS